MFSPANPFFQYRQRRVFPQQSLAVKMLHSSHAANRISFLCKMFRGAGKPTIPLEKLTQRRSDYLTAICFIDEGGAQWPYFRCQNYYDCVAIFLTRWAQNENRYVNINLDGKAHRPCASLSYYTENVVQVLELIGVEPIVHHRKRFAYGWQIKRHDKGTTVGFVQPGLLGFEGALLCVIDRKRIAEFELCYASSLYLYATQTLQQVEPETYFTRKANGMQPIKPLTRYIQEAANLGALEKVHSHSANTQNASFVVLRILKARFDENTLQCLLQQLETLNINNKD